MEASLISEIRAYVRRSLQRQLPITEEMQTRLPGKKYPRMKRIAFPPLIPLSTNLSEALRKRRSSRNFSLHAPMSLSQLGALLGYSLGKVATDRERPYPSGGALYPLEAYVLVHSVTDLERGVYHYEPENHELEYLWPIPEDVPITKLISAGSWVGFASCLIVFTSVWERSSKKYGDFAYPLSLIESGAAGQNLSLVGAALDIGICLSEAYDESKLRDTLDLPSGEEAIYAVVAGQKNANHES